MSDGALDRSREDLPLDFSLPLAGVPLRELLRQ